ncbi:hypothetical protein ACO0LB_10110 [Undibacterium sp. SXout7W]|uniref:hypothetical protein n=1 Tax=Undibacterium sp. SXout7W TaxID=3413049 RepID=UPI003BF1EB56
MTRRKVLTKDQVKQIRSEHSNKRGYGYKSLSEKYGVGLSTIRDVVKYYTYAGVYP